MKDQADFPEHRFSVYEKLVKSNFSFLVENYGFKLSNIEREDGSYIVLKYLSERVFIKFYYGPPGFELDFYIGRVGIEDRPDRTAVASGDLLCHCKDTRWTDYKLYSAHSYENLYKCLPKLAELLKACGADCLRGESLAYEKILFEKKININQWCNEQELKQVKKIASEAWQNKDYTRFVEVFDPIANALSPSEKKKLEYARKHLCGKG